MGNEKSKEKTEKKKITQQPLEELVFRRKESFDNTSINFKDDSYKTRPDTLQQNTINTPEKVLIEKGETYKTIDVYKKDTEKKDYLPKFDDSAYKTQPTAESSLASEISSQTENFTGQASNKNRTSPQLEQFFGGRLEKDTEEYKRKEIVSRDISFQEEEKETYKRKLKTQFV